MRSGPIRARRFAAVRKGESLSEARSHGRGGWITYSGAKQSARGELDVKVVSYFAEVTRMGAELDPFSERLAVETLGESKWHGPVVTSG